MKKWTALMLALCMILSLAACGAEEPAMSEEMKAYYDYWNGDWYGWWCVLEGTGIYADWATEEGYYWDFCVEIYVDPEQGSLIMWDEVGSKDQPLSGMDVVITDDGKLKSVEGVFNANGPIGEGDWLLEPGTAEDGLVLISGTYVDPENSENTFEYGLMMKPWGDDWAAEAAEDEALLPYLFYDWYLPLIEKGAAMPDKIG